MITTNDTMDPCSFEIKKDGEHVGYAFWHPGNREPGISLSKAFSFLTWEEIDQVRRVYEEKRKGMRPY